MTKRDELIALGGVGAKVRELEWVEMPDRDPESASWIAETDLGRSYRVFAAWWGAQNKYGYVFDGFYHTENEAKAAAQADYERRVLSALEVPAAGDGEPVAWAEIGSRGQALTVRAEKSAFCTTPLYTAQPADAGMREVLADLLQKIEYASRKDSLSDRERLQSVRSIVCAAISKAALTASGATTKSDGGEPANWREIEMMRLIDLLRSEEGDSVTILCDNPDPRTEAENNAVICNGGWTNYKDRRFNGVGVLDALSAAMIEYKRPKSDGGDLALAAECAGKLCEDCPPVGYPTDKTRCSPCPRRTTKSDVEALAATTAERPGTVTSEPEPSTSDPSSTRSEVSVEELARYLDPLVFDNNPVVRHCYCSPLRVDVCQSRLIDKARALLDQFEIRRK